jgi:hypothetical protein
VADRRIILVFAGSFEIASRWASEEGLPRNSWKFVQGPRDIEGWKDFELKTLHGAFDNKDRANAYRLAQAKAGIL